MGLELYLKHLRFAGGMMSRRMTLDTVSVTSEEIYKLVLFVGWRAQSDISRALN